ncbi:MAG: hypothetical protein LBH29_05915, partial [Elusimicrobiota bacterium]|nr:hypothetical protein [Elusimicrobiota bacterium]
SFFISAEDISKEKTFERSTADYDIREIELLKKEIDILKREIELLKHERSMEVIDRCADSYNL